MRRCLFRARVLVLALPLLVASLGVGPASPGVAAATLPADLLSQPASFDRVPVAWDLSGPDVHAIVHASVRYEGPGLGTPTVLFALENPEGEVVMYGMHISDRIHVTDGHTEEGDVRLVEVAKGIVDAWHRYDVRVEGDTYRFAIDGGETTARTLHAATAARFVDDARLAEIQADTGHTGMPVDTARERVLPAEVATTTFHQPLAEDGWSAHETDPGSLQVEESGWGDLGMGRLHVATDPIPGNLAYAHAPVPDHAGAYLAEASFRPWAVGLEYVDGVPDHQAVLAGVSGPADAPVVRWALVMAQVGVEYDRWSLFLVDAEDHRTQVAPVWGTNEWHWVRVLVEEGADALTIQMDDADAGLRFTFSDLPASDRLAIGDVWADHPYWTGSGTGFYDNVVILPGAGG